MSSILDIAPDDVILYLESKQDFNQWDNYTIENIIKRLGYSDDLKTIVPTKQLQLYYAIKILNYSSKPTEKGIEIRFNKSNEPAYKDDEFLQKVQKVITDAREVLFRANSKLSSDIEDDVIFMRTILGDFTEEFFSDEAKVSNRNVMTYREGLIVAKTIKYFRELLEESGIKLDLSNRRFSNNTKGYKFTKPSEVKHLVNAYLVGSILITDKRRLSRIISKAYKLILKP